MEEDPTEARLVVNWVYPAIPASARVGDWWNGVKITEAQWLDAQRNAKRPLKQITGGREIPNKHPTLAKVAKPPRKNWWHAYWLFWLFGMVVTGFLIPEINAILNKQKGDTLSENIRLWLKTDTPGGGASWLVVATGLFTLVVWLTGHIAQWPGWPLTGGN
jgi:hypothetical protein